MNTDKQRRGFIGVHRWLKMVFPEFASVAGVQPEDGGSGTGLKVDHGRTTVALSE
jgi:hypothetical protein